MVSAVFGGKPMDASMVTWCKRITRGNLTTIVAGPRTMLKATFVLKPGKKHALIEYMNLHGGNKGKAQAGIYELERDPQALHVRAMQARAIRFRFEAGRRPVIHDMAASQAVNGGVGLWAMGAWRW